MNRLLVLSLPIFLACVLAVETRAQTMPSKDARLGKPLDYNGYFPWTPPNSLNAWKKRREFVRTQVKVANGIWPMPKKTPLNPTIHGKIKRDGYTIEKVYFESLPGFHVTGNLYRPTDIKKSQRVPGVLCPHGHWGGRHDPDTNGRFYEAGDGSVKSQIESGAEKFEAGAKYPLQARCATLARMGCVVFHYDMIGYGDSQQFLHPLTKANPKGGFSDATGELWLHSFMGLQTWNSIRALDFLTGLKEVDSKRLAVTGASGGGTQTFLLAAVDDRVDVAWPAVMVSTAMQGGCVCENCTYLRVNTGNIELAALFAPKPLGMSAANDWTKELETKGLPQLQQLYKMYGKADNVFGKAWTQFGHNYNNVSREAMYNWFNKHLNLGHKTPVVERPFVPVPPKELSVYDKDHPRPDQLDLKAFRAMLRKQDMIQFDSLVPTDKKSWNTYRSIVGPALSVMVNDSLPSPKEVAEVGKDGTASIDASGLEINKMHITRKGKGEVIPALWMRSKNFNGTAVVWVSETGSASLMNNGKPVAEIQALLDKGLGVFSLDPFLTGAYGDAKTPPINSTYPGYTWGYNRTVLANRVHDILTAVAMAKKQANVKTVHLVGTGEAGPWVLLARALCGDAVARTAADMDQFRFAGVSKLSDPMMLPGAERYGDMGGLTALCAPHELFLHNAKSVDVEECIQAAYAASGQENKLTMNPKQSSATDVVNWLTR